MDQSAKGQGCEGNLAMTAPIIIMLIFSLQLSIAEERDRRRAFAIAS